MEQQKEKPPDRNEGQQNPPGLTKPHAKTQPPNGRRASNPYPREFKSFKLIVDPALVHGAFKVYRYDGMIPGQANPPSVIVRDPRKRKTSARPQEAMVLPVPQFQIDANFVGKIPPTDVTFTNLNDNVGEIFLHNLSSRFGLVESVTLYVHPISHRHLGIGHAIFKNPRDAKSCVDKLNGTLVMGQKVNVFYDPGGKKCKERFIEVTTQKPGSARDSDRKASTSAAVNSSSTRSAPLSLKSAPSESSSSLCPVLSKNHLMHHGHQSYHHYKDQHNPLQHTTPSSPRIKNKSEQPHLNNANYSGNPGSDKVYEDGDHSPKIDLDTRIKMMLEGHTAGSEFAKIFVDLNISASPGDATDSHMSAIKRAKFNDMRSEVAKIWDSDSDDEVKRQPFACKFKQSFVPVYDGIQEGKSLHNLRDSSNPQQNSMSPPPSPFLSESTLLSSTPTGKTGKANHEFDQISDDDDGQIGGPGRGGKDHVSLSSLSPKDASTSGVRPSRFGNVPPVQLHDQHSSYNYGEYYNISYSINYQAPWGAHHHPGEQQHDQQPHHPEYQVNYPPGFGGPYEQHHHHHYPNGVYLPNTHQFPYRPVEEPVPEPPKQEDHKNPELLIKAIIKLIVDDLRKVLRRDCNRKLVETEAFKMYEEWWGMKESEMKRKLDEENAKNIPSTSTAANLATVPDIMIEEGTTEDVKVVPRANGLINSLGQGILGIPKLPSIQRNIKVSEPVEDGDSRKSFLYSESDSAASSDDDDIVLRNANPPICSRSTGEDFDGTSSVSSRSSAREQEFQVIRNAEVISATDDEDEFSKFKSGSVEDDEEMDVPPTPRKMEVEDISSDDDLPKFAFRTPEHEEEANSDFYRVTLPPTPGASPVKAPQDAVISTTLRIKHETDTDSNVDEARPDLTASIKVAPECKDTYRESGRLQTTTDRELDNEKPLIIPLDVLQPRGQKKSSKTIVFRPRAEHEKFDLVYEFLQEGIDTEDINYFHKAYNNLLLDHTLYWLKYTHWDDHPATVIKKKKPKSKHGKAGEEGSLRTRGFVRITPEEKSRAMGGQKRNVVPMSFDGALLISENRITADLGKTRETHIREARSNQRRLLTVLGTESDLLKFNQLHFRKKSLRFAKSPIHDWGLFAAEPIAADEMVIEYVGEVIRPVIADLREKKYEAQGIGSSYLFKIDKETIIDATRCGNLSKFINHSCNPNCYAKVITIEGNKRMVIYSKQPIAVAEEITYDYKFPIEDKKIPCLCGTPQCRGTLN